MLEGDNPAIAIETLPKYPAKVLPGLLATGTQGNLIVHADHSLRTSPSGRVALCGPSWSGSRQQMYGPSLSPAASDRSLHASSDRSVPLSVIAIRLRERLGCRPCQTRKRSSHRSGRSIRGLGPSLRRQFRSLDIDQFRPYSSRSPSSLGWTSIPNCSRSQNSRGFVRPSQK